MKRRLPVVVLSLLVVTGLVGCNETTSENTTEESTSVQTVPDEVVDISVWASTADTAAMEAIEDGFNALNPMTPVKITATPVSEGDVGGMFAKDAEKVADIAHVPGDVVADMITNNYIAPFTDSDEVLDGDIPASALSTAEDSNGTLYGLPFSINTYFMYYDTSFYTAEQVTSIESMIATAKAAGTDTAFSYENSDGWYGQAFFMSDGDGIFTENGTNPNETYLKQPAALNAAKAMVEIYKAGNCDFDDSETISTNLSNSHAFVSGSWSYDAVATAWGAENVGMTHLPTVKMGGEDRQLLSVGDYKSIVVANNSEHKTLAKKLAYYMASAEGQLLRWDHNNGSTVPTSSELNSDADFQAENKFADVVNALLMSGTFKQNNNTNFNRWWDAWPVCQLEIKNNYATATDADLTGYLTTLDATLTAASTAA
ncbi:MAG: hypothetical protein PHW22_00860 [Bacilli bacterium]|nr:hypothetical protein [Bacilli bacterium]